MTLILPVTVFIAAALVRLAAAYRGELSAAEAGGAYERLLLPLLDPSTARLVGAALGALGASVLTMAFQRRGDVSLTLVVACLAILDPLSIATTSDAGPGGALALAGSCAVAVALLPSRTIVMGAGIGAVLAVLLALPAHPTAVSALAPDAVFLTWSRPASVWLGILPACIHHIGYAVVPLAIGGLFRPGGLRLGLFLVAAFGCAFLVDAGSPERLDAFAMTSPPCIALAALAMSGLAPDLRGRIGWLAVILAVHAPVLVSDLTRGGPGYPWRAATMHVKGDADRALYSTLPVVASAAFGRTVLALPPPGPELDRILRSDEPITLVLPLEGGSLDAPDLPDPAAALQRIERHKVEDAASRPRRFDLYRFEIRVFRLPQDPPAKPTSE